jgi:hypothetical protein
MLTFSTTEFAWEGLRGVAEASDLGLTAGKPIPHCFTVQDMPGRDGHTSSLVFNLETVDRGDEGDAAGWRFSSYEGHRILIIKPCTPASESCRGELSALLSVTNKLLEKTSSVKR